MEIVTNTWFITVGVCTKSCLTVVQDFFLPKISFFQIQFVYSGPILESGHACDFSKKSAKYLKIWAKMHKI